MKVAILKLSPETLRRILYMPEDFEIVGIISDPANRQLHVAVQSEFLPEVPNGQLIPELQGTISVEYMSYDPNYKKITAKYEVTAPPTGNTK